MANVWNLFGFKIGKRDDEKEITQPSFTPPSNDDGSYTVTTAAQFGTTALDLDGSTKNEVELITRYREASLQPELEAAIEDIVNEAIIHDDNGESVKLTMEKLKQPDKIKKAIEDEFKTILRLLNFNNMGGDIFRRWYIDGRLFYHVMVDVENPQKGIQELRYIDPRKIRKIREVKKQKDPNTGVDIITTAQEYYIYSDRISNSPTTTSVIGVKIAPDSVINVNSGLMDPKRNIVLSYIHKALKPLSQLRIIEDAAVIYRLCLVGDTRIKTDTGWKYIKDIQENDIVYSYWGPEKGLIQTNVIKQWKTGTKQTYTVSSKHFSITGTDNHPILVLDKTTGIAEYINISDIIPTKHCFIVDTNQKKYNIFDSYYPECLDECFINPNYDESKVNIIKKVCESLEFTSVSNSEYSEFWSANIKTTSKKFIEELKELWNSFGLTTDNIFFNDEKWNLTIYQKYLPKFDPIISVQEANIEDVYEIEVASEKHNFIANGVPVHNSRSPERRIFYIDVGNLPRIKAEQYVRDIMTKHKNKLVYDASTGEVKSDSKHLCLAMNTKVPLLDGRTLTLSEIANEYKEKQLWAYSCDPITGKFAPGLITWAGVTRKDAPVMKITLDNGKEIICTPEHKFPTWKNGLVEAKDLVEGESMIPFYTRERNVKKSNPNDVYLELFENNTKKWKFVHRLVAEWKDEVGLGEEWTYKIEGEKKTVHHKDLGRFNNNPENLVKMNTKDHINYHLSLVSKEKRIEMGQKGGKKSSELGKSQENFAKGREVFKELMKDPEYNAEFRQKQSDGWSEESKEISRQRAKKLKIYELSGIKTKELFKDPEYRAARMAKYKTEYTQEILDLFDKYIIMGYTHQQICDGINKEADFEAWAKLNQSKVGTQKDWSKITRSDIDRITKDAGFSGVRKYKEYLLHKNHKIAKIEFLPETMDTGCLTIDGNEIYHDYHTFALDAGIYTKNSMLEDYFLPRRSDQRSTEITTLPGAQNLGEISDISYFEKKLYKSLGVPVTRLDPSQATSVGRATEITRDELKFSKFIDKLRAKFSELFDQALRIQLVLKGVCTEEEWNLFKENVFYDYLKDNNFIELKESELMQERLGVLALIDQYAGKYYSKEWIQENILRLNDIEITEMEEQIQKEREVDFNQQAQDQERQIQLQAQGVQLQNELMPNPEQQIDAGDDGTGQQEPSKKSNNPYLQ